MRSLSVIAAILVCGLLAATARAEALPPLEVRRGQASNPDWLSVEVEPDGEGLYAVALRAQSREDEAIAGYDLTLVVDQGEMKGLRVGVPANQVRPGFTAGMTLPRKIASNGMLVLIECPEFGNEGRMYRIDLNSYLERADVQQEAGGGADADRAAVAREVLRTENERLERAIQQIKDLLVSARIADPERLAWYHSQISAFAAAKNLNAAILAREDEELLLTAAKAVVHATIENNYDGIFRREAAVTDENRADFAQDIQILRREIGELKAKLEVLGG